MLGDIKKSHGFTSEESKMNSTSQPFCENGRVKNVIEENRFIQDAGINQHIIFPELFH